MLMSMVMTSGLRDSARVTASRPSLAWPTTCSWASALRMDSRTLRMKAESSTMRTRNFLMAVTAMVLLHDRNSGPRRLRSDELFDRRDQLIFLDGFGQE